MTVVKAKILKKLEALGHAYFYGLIFLAGQPGAYVSLYPVLFVYVLCSRRIHAVTRPYLDKRFPDKGRLYKWLATYKNVIWFGKVLVDRAWLGIRKNVELAGELEGRDTLLELIGQGRGVVLLTAHVGNWQTALSHICQLAVPVNSLMHYEQEAVAKHYFDLRKEPVPFKIINSEGYLGGLVESTAALQKGEVVTIMGDRFAGGPHVTVDFLGSPVRMPAAAYSLAASTGAPVVVLLAAKTGMKSYNLKVWEVFHPQPGDRDERRENMQRAAAVFTRALEAYVQKYPCQWYNFFDFWKQ